MKLKLLYTGCLLICLSTIASSNECPRYCHHTAGKIVTPGVSTSSPGQRSAATAEEDGAEGSQSTPLTLVKLLYI
jgi:hypothetical protein